MNLVETAFHLFTCYGIRPVSMMDIAKACPEKQQEKLTKATLVKHCSRKMENEIRDMISGLPLSHLNETEQILLIYKELMKYIRKVHPAFFYDLKKIHPEIYSHLVQTVDSAVFGEVKSLLEKGQHTGHISKSIDVDLECILHKMMLEKLVAESGSGTQQFQPDQVFEQLFRIRLKGIQVN